MCARTGAPATELNATQRLGVTFRVALRVARPSVVRRVGETAKPRDGVAAPTGDGLARYVDAAQGAAHVGKLALGLCAGAGGILRDNALAVCLQETTQLVCLLAAGYLALGRPPRRTWPETLPSPSIALAQWE
jgi:hypothetical protein